MMFKSDYLSYRISIIAVLFSCASCNQTESTEHDKDRVKQTVVVFGQNAPTAPKRANAFYTPNHIRYYDQHMVRIERPFKNGSAADTLVVEHAKEVFPITLFYNYVTFNYYFTRGDTVFFSFIDDIPTVDSINREANPLDLNFTKHFRNHFKKPLKGDNLLRPAPKDLPPAIERFQKVENQYTIQKAYIDSLLGSGSIAPELAPYYHAENNSDFFRNISSPDFAVFFSDTIRQCQVREFVNQPNLLGHPHYHDFLAWKYLWSPSLGIKRVKHAQGMTLDYKDAYEKIKAQQLDSDVEMYLLFHCLQNIHDEDSKDAFKTFLSRFREDVTDTAYLAYVDRNFEGSLLDLSGKSVLTNVLRNRKFDYGDYLDELKGNVVYVDLWASWCVPCRAAMPASHQLAATYRDEAVKFVYLSLDERFDHWENAVQEEGLFSNGDSFLLLDAKHAALPKQIGLTSIPRYLLYDKAGNLVHQNAPGPDSEELQELINKHLAM